MIKTDKVLYRTRSLGEYNWLMNELEAAGLTWEDGSLATEHQSYWADYLPDTCIFLDNKKVHCSYLDFYKENPIFRDYEYIEVSDLIENEEETDAQDKTEEETDAIEELEAIHKQLTSQIEDLRKQGKEPKAIEYTIKVCFE